MIIPAPRALIAEDEPLLAAALQHELAQAWPELQVAATVGDGLSAVREALALQPEVLFFDIRMPGQSGLEAAAELVDAWPDGKPFPALVFLTAYDQYAVQAFEAQAVDYLLKPVQAGRLQKTVARVQQLLARTQRRRAAARDHARPAAQPAGGRVLSPATGAAPAGGLLRFIQAGHGSRIEMVPVDEVLVFEAADKYVRVLTAAREHLIRTPLRELLAQLDTQQFWQIHRGTLVRASAIASAVRSESGKLTLQLHGRPEAFAVSRRRQCLRIPRGMLRGQGLQPVARRQQIDGIGAGVFPEHLAPVGLRRIGQ
jgi:DNA-binding LytR/AlgR family response regulator